MAAVGAESDRFVSLMYRRALSCDFSLFLLFFVIIINLKALIFEFSLPCWNIRMLQAHFAVYIPILIDIHRGERINNWRMEFA
jgi:hypothetical protein